MSALNLILIGMPACGKSTLGVMAAKALGWDFLDTDVHVQVRERATLQALIEARGVAAFKALEAEHVRALTLDRTVVATGGSVVFSAAAMAHLRALGRVVWLQVGLDELARRVGDLAARGVLHRPGQTLGDILLEREPLYRRFAHAAVRCDGRAPEAVVAELAAAVRAPKPSL